MNNENLTIDTLTEFAKPYRDKLSIKNQKKEQKNKIKAEKLNKRIEMKIQKKSKKLIKKITSKIIRTAKKGFDEYNLLIPVKYVRVKGLNRYTKDCIEKVKTYYTDKGFSVITGKSTKWYFDEYKFGNPYPTFYYSITISWKKRR